MQPNDTDLFNPSLQGQAQRIPAEAERPWRLWSPFWVAFFGGILPYVVVAHQNSRRLGLPETQQRLILTIGAVGLVATVIVTYGLTAWLGDERGTIIRLGGRIVAVLAFLAGYAIQKSADRRYSFATNGAYASLWRFGLAVTILLGFVQNIAVAWVVQQIP